ncbi:MAG: MbtH family protein [Hassallia sp. WJT32-NPBG1]|jgi:MbtH protein|nr:MbtH family protein [Hassallia sp. WJT32-NPBG1]
MNNNQQNDDTIYLFMVNHEEEYSIWAKWKKELRYWIFRSLSKSGKG